MLNNYLKYLNMLDEKLNQFSKNKSPIFFAKRDVQSAAKMPDIRFQRLNFNI